MPADYRARWLSPGRHAALSRSELHGLLLLELAGGRFVLIEPAGVSLADGAVLGPGEADFELQPPWCRSPADVVAEARRLGGLEE